MTSSFALGVNVPWWNGQFGHDLAPNHLRGWRAWLDPDDSAYEQRWQHIDTTFARLSAEFACRVVRMWLFEGGEGLCVDGPQLRLDALVLRHVERMHRTAHAHGIQIYWCLLASHRDHTRDAFDLEARVINQGDDMPFYQTVLRPVCEMLVKQGNLYGVDLINEPEQHLASQSVTAMALQQWVGAQCENMKRDYGSSLRVSVGSAGQAWLGQKPVRSLDMYRGLGLSFYDLHVYLHPWSSLPVVRGLFDAPVLIGVFGQRWPWRSDLMQAQVAERVLRQAAGKGYCGALAWYFHEPSGLRHARRAERHALVSRAGHVRKIANVFTKRA